MHEQWFKNDNLKTSFVWWRDWHWSSHHYRKHTMCGNNTLTTCRKWVGHKPSMVIEMTLGDIWLSFQWCLPISPFPAQFAQFLPQLSSYFALSHFTLLPFHPFTISPFYHFALCSLPIVRSFAIAPFALFPPRSYVIPWLKYLTTLFWRVKLTGCARSVNNLVRDGDEMSSPQYIHDQVAASW
jgi:hypothetical protein